MQVQIRWMKQAIRQLDAVTVRGEQMFGQRIAAKFYWHVKSYENRLADNPYMGYPEPLLEGRDRNYRSLIVHEHFKLIYYVDEKRLILFIYALWDTRREPRKLSQRIHSK